MFLIRSMNSRKVIRLTFAAFEGNESFGTVRKMRERCASEINSVQTTFSFKICKLLITQMLSPVVFRCLIALRRKKNRFSSEYRGLGNDLRINFLRCHSQFLVQSEWQQMRSDYELARRNATSSSCG